MGRIEGQSSRSGNKGVDRGDTGRVPVSRRPRLLVMTSTYPRWVGDPEPGFVHELAKRLAARFDIMVVCPHAAGAARREVLEGVQVRRYRYATTSWETLVNDGGILSNLARRRWKWLLLPTFVLGQWLCVLRLKLTWKPDVVHAHWLVPQGIVAASAGLAPLVVTSHGADLFALRSGLFRRLRAWVVERADAVTVVSEAMRRKLMAECPDANGLVMPMGVDLDGRFSNDGTCVRSSKTILFVGRLVEKKGLIYLIEALPRVLATHPGTRLDIVGFGPEKQRLVDRVHELGLEASVHFVGAVPQAELPGYYRSATMFVAPFIEASDGDQEGLGLVVAEAVGCLCPVIVGDVPAVHDFFGEASTHLVPQRDALALANAIVRVLDAPALASEQAVGLLHALRRRFSWEAVADGYAHLFRRMVKGERCSHD